jgi:hypothetical protein
MSVYMSDSWGGWGGSGVCSHLSAAPPPRPAQGSSARRTPSTRPSLTARNPLLAFSFALIMR